MESAKKKNGKVELFRFVFTMIIVWYHCQRHYFEVDASTIHKAFCYRGYLGVEFFFVVTGYLMAAAIYKRQQSGGAYDLGRETAAFIWRKITAILPYHLVAFAILFAAWFFEKSRTLKEIVVRVIHVFPGITLLDKIGFDYGDLNRVEWYISAMIFALMVLYPLCRKYYSMFVHVIAPAGGIFALGYLYQTYGSFAKNQEWTGLFFSGLIRAAAEIALGAAAFELARVLRAHVFTRAERVWLTVLEWLCWSAAVLFVMATFPAKYEIFFLAVVLCALTLAFSDQVYGNDLCANRFFYRLGSFSLPIYLSQVLPLDMVEKYGADLGPWEKTAVMTCATLLNALVCYGVVLLFRRGREKLRTGRKTQMR